MSRKLWTILKKGVDNYLIINVFCARELHILILNVVSMTYLMLHTRRQQIHNDIGARWTHEEHHISVCVWIYRAYILSTWLQYFSSIVLYINLSYPVYCVHNCGIAVHVFFFFLSGIVFNFLVPWCNIHHKASTAGWVYPSYD